MVSPFLWNFYHKGDQVLKEWENDPDRKDAVPPTVIISGKKPRGEWERINLDEWMEADKKRDYLKELMAGAHTNRDKSELRFLAEENKEANPKVFKKVRYFLPEKKRNFELDVDIRVKMEQIPLKDYIDAQWSPKWYRGSCKCCFPDHKDKTASFHMYEQTNTFYCF